MALPNVCPTCRTLRAPNARYCHVCGHAYSMEDSDLDPPPIEEQPEVRLSVGSGFRFGVGFMIAAFIVGLVGSILWLVLFAAILGSMFRFGR